MIYPENHISIPLSNFIASNFITEGVITCYKIEDKYDAKNNLTLEEFRRIAKKDYNNIVTSKGKPWKQNENGSLLALSMNHSNIYCIDIDEDISWDNIPEILKELPYTKSRNKKLPHFYFRIDDLNMKKIEEKNGKISVFQNQTDNLKFCKGELLTGNTWELKTNQVYNYNGILPTLKWKDVKELIIEQDVKRFEENAGVGNKQIQFFVNEVDEDMTTEEDNDGDTEKEVEIKPKKTYKKSEAKKEQEETKAIHNKQTEELAKDNKEIDKQFARLRIISKLWKPERINNYSSWLEFTWAIINSFEKQGKPIWEELSKELYTRTDKSFDIEGNKQIWDNEFSKKKKDRKGLSIATLYYWAKTDKPEEYEKLFNQFKINWDRLTQAQFAKMLCSDKFLGENVVFTGKKKEMQGYKFNGVYWIDLGLHNAEIKKNIFDNLYDLYMKEFWKVADQFEEDKQTTILINIKQLDNNVFRNNVIECLKTEKYIEKIEWNKDRDLFAFDDCIYNLKTGKFIKSSPTQYINWTCGYSYGITKDEKGNTIIPEYQEEQAICIKFISSLFDDEGQINYILKRCASYMKQMNAEEKIEFWTGDGRNGKGTLTKLLNEMLGKYFGELNIGFYTTYEKSADAPNNNLFNLRYARLINTSEVGEDAKNGNEAQTFITANVKRLSGGDKLVARQPHEKEQIEFYAGKPLVQTNVMPNLPLIELEKNFSLRERVVVIRFPFRFTDNEKDLKKDPSVYKRRDNTLKEQFETNENLKRGFWRLLTSKYYPLYLSEGVVLPEIIKKETLNYFDASNKVKTWFDDNIEIVEPNEDNKFTNDIECADLFQHFCNFNTKGFMKKSQFIEYLTNIVGKAKNQKERGIASRQNRVYLRGYKYNNDEETNNVCLLTKQKTKKVIQEPTDNDLDIEEEYEDL